MIGFSYPVVPEGPGAHPHPDERPHDETEHLDRAVEAFTAVGKELGVIS